MLRVKQVKIVAFKTNSRWFSMQPKLPECKFVPEKYRGLSLEEMLNIKRTRLNPALSTYYGSPIAFCQGYKQYLFDLDGKRYLDMFGGICTVSVGHSHPKITEVVRNQISTLGHVSNVYLHPKICEYAQRLTDKFPKDLKVVYFVNSGSEANDLAVLMARAYTKNIDILALKNSFHGMTYQVMALTSNSSYKYGVPQASGVHTIMNPDVYKGRWGGSKCRNSPVQTSRTCSCLSNNCEANEKYISELRDVFRYNVKPGNLAAFFAESIQGVGGTVQYPKNYLKEAVEIVHQNGGVFVSDEVQTGFGRTGEHFWGFEMHEITPDIVTMAKGIGNGIPLAAVVTKPEIAEALTTATHFNTYGGNPVSCAAGIAVLDIIAEENLQANSLTIGTYLLEELENLKFKYSAIGDVRGKGLMIGIELVEDENATPLEKNKFLKIWEKCRDYGVLLGRGGIDGNVFRIKPPMCISKEDADFTIQVLDKTLEEEA